MSARQRQNPRGPVEMTVPGDGALDGQSDAFPPAKDADEGHWDNELSRGALTTQSLHEGGQSMVGRCGLVQPTDLRQKRPIPEKQAGKIAFIIIMTIISARLTRPAPRRRHRCYLLRAFLWHLLL
jgi:hypothetical protein